MSILDKFMNDPKSKAEDVGRPKIRTLVLAGAVIAMMAAGAETSVEQKPQNFSFTMPETSETIADINARVNPPKIEVASTAGTPEADNLDGYASTADIKSALSVFSPDDHVFYHGDSELRQRMANGESTITWAQANFMQNIAGQVYKVGGNETLSEGQVAGLVDYFKANINQPAVAECINDMGTRAAMASPIAHKCLMNTDGLDAGPQTGKSEFYQKLRAKIDHNGPTLG